MVVQCMSQFKFKWTLSAKKSHEFWQWSKLVSSKRLSLFFKKYGNESASERKKNKISSVPEILHLTGDDAALDSPTLDPGYDQ